MKKEIGYRCLFCGGDNYSFVHNMFVCFDCGCRYKMGTTTIQLVDATLCPVCQKPTLSNISKNGGWYKHCTYCSFQFGPKRELTLLEKRWEALFDKHKGSQTKRKRESRPVLVEEKMTVTNTNTTANISFENKPPKKRGRKKKVIAEAKDALFGELELTEDYQGGKL